MAQNTSQPIPPSLAAQLDLVGLSARLVVQRQDGQPLTQNDQEALEAVLACYDAEHASPVSDDDAARAAAGALAQLDAQAPKATGTHG